MSQSFPSSQSLRLLHVEDSTADVELIRHLLAREWSDCRSEQVETHEQLLAALQSPASDFDVILSDFSMPKFNGLSALEVARRHRPDIPFIFVSGTIGEENAVKALKQGATDYVLKDRMARLPSAVRRALDEKCEERRLEKQSLQAQRLESVSMLAGGIARDLNNVLTPVLMSASLLRRKIEDAEARRWLEILEASAQQGADLVRQISAFTNGMNGERIPLQPQFIIQDVVKLLGGALPRSIAIETYIPRELWLISSNPTQLSQALMSLCVNARDAMPDGGSLIIRAQNVVVDEVPARANSNARPGKYVLIDVIDTGNGIPARMLDRIFDFTAKTKWKNAGLGLSAVQGIAQSHGGFLQVRSEEGRGADFSLYFPAIVSVAPAEQRLYSPLVPLSSGHNGTVLIIDGEDSMREIGGALLEAHGYRMLGAPDGKTGLELYRNHANEINAVMINFVPPFKQGLEVVAALRLANPDVRILVLSGAPEPAKTGISTEPGRLEFLAKPMSGHALLCALDHLCAEQTIAQNGSWNISV
ncbi:MAG: response regulator [Verrucomicrobiota bacterium]|nr:response regulator [Verrucomicrobiota bacterium]